MGVGDFNRDGNPNILWWNQADGRVYVWYMNGAAFAAEQYIATVADTQWKIRAVMDVNRDENPDILWHHQETGDIYVWYMNGATWVSDQFIRTVK